MENEVITTPTPAGEKVMRGFFTLAGGIAGYFLGFAFVQRGWLSGPADEFLIGFVGVLTAFLASKRLARYCGRWWNQMIYALANIPADSVFAAGVGATAGLLITVLVSNLLAQIPFYTWYYSLLLALILAVGSAGFFVNNRRLFPFLPQPDAGASQLGNAPKVLDSSALIDGRIPDLVHAHFIRGNLIVPTFVLTELQTIADSSDQLKRPRGRRALEVIDQLASALGDQLRITEAQRHGLPVDEALVKLCQELGADLVTTDYNLDKIAAVQGVTTLNLHRLATAMKPNLLPGDRVVLHIVKEGRESGQGLAYLEDGTMVVVEHTADRIGESVLTTITSNLQTNVGRMIFAKPVAQE